MSTVVISKLGHPDKVINSDTLKSNPRSVPLVDGSTAAQQDTSDAEDDDDNGIIAFKLSKKLTSLVKGSAMSAQSLCFASTFSSVTDYRLFFCFIFIRSNHVI